MKGFTMKAMWLVSVISLAAVALAASGCMHGRGGCNGGCCGGGCSAQSGPTYGAPAYGSPPTGSPVPLFEGSGSR